jgi:hypothetical protein
MKKYILYILTGFILNASATSCNKIDTIAETNLAQRMLEDKSWFLDYSEEGTINKTYIGQSTYYITFLKNLTTLDSDGLNGTYTVIKTNSQLQIYVRAKTNNGNSIEYTYNIISIGANKLILSYILNGKTTKLFYSSTK